MQNGRISHEVRDSRTGDLIAVLDVIEPPQAIPDAGMIELAADCNGRSVRVRIFPPATQARRAA